MIIYQATKTQFLQHAWRDDIEDVVLRRTGAGDVRSPKSQGHRCRRYDRQKPTVHPNFVAGRLVPLSLMPAWIQDFAWFFPFQWAFGFPIESLVGNMTTNELLRGLGMQLAWILFGVILVNIIWKFAIRKFSAVGG